MGYWASALSDRGSLFLSTRSINEASICKHNIQVYLKSPEPESGMLKKQAKGNFTLIFKGPTGVLNNFVYLILDNSKILFKIDSLERVFLSIETPLEFDNIKQMSLMYQQYNGLNVESKWVFKSIDIYSGDHQKYFKFCPIAEYFHTGINYDYEKCWWKFF